MMKQWGPRMFVCTVPSTLHSRLRGKSAWSAHWPIRPGFQHGKDGWWSVSVRVLDTVYVLGRNPRARR